jgi:hypothetical protein
MGTEGESAAPTVSSADLVSAAFNEAPPAVEDTTSTTDNFPPVADTSSNNSTGHPAWQEILGVVPEVLHDKIKPTLQKWDQGVQQKLEEYTRTYDPYKPVIETGATVDELQAGYQLMQLLNADPQKFYDAMRDHYKFGDSGQGDTSSAETLDLAEFSEDISKHPEFQKLATQQQQMVEAWQADQQAKQQAQADEWLTTKQTEITDQLKEKSLTPDWDYILNKAMTYSQKDGNYDKGLERATADYVALVDKTRTPVANLTAPPVIAPNGAVPSSSVAVDTLKDPDTRKKLLAQALNEALRE